MSRQSKFTPERQKIILDGLKAGLTRTAAAGRAGVDVSALSHWCERFSTFSIECLNAEAEAEARFTATMAQAAAPHDVLVTTETITADGERTIKTETRREFDWRAAESWLKRRRRKDWGDNVSFDLEREIAELLAELAGTREDQTP